ncbi:Omega-hydroxypalmitate O-feruloyl transferase [Linum perenne]
MATNGVNYQFQPTVTRGEPITVEPAAADQNHNPGKYYYLSNIDRLPAYVQTLYWYRANHNDDVSRVIKDALSKVLVHYYPLTGRLTITPLGKLAITFAGDRGALFVEAEADCCLDDIGDLADPRVDVAEKMVYSACPGATCQFFWLCHKKVTKFKCGGFSLGIVANHCPMDGVSATKFVNSWGELSRGLSMSDQPFLDRTILKPREPPQIQFPHLEYATMEDKSSSSTSTLAGEKFVHKSFCFDPDTIARIKAEASTDHRRCTTFEALATFVWKARTRALRMAPDQPTKFLVPVDIRNKVDPPLPEGYFGNGVYFAGTTCLARDVVDRPLNYLVGLVQEGIAVTNEYVRSGIDYVEATGGMLASDYTMMASKWSRGLDFENADFGWGPPVASVPVESSIDYTVVFVAAGGDKKSVRIFVSLKASAMKLFSEFVGSLPRAMMSGPDRIN